MSGHQSRRQSAGSRNVPAASDHRLDQFAAAVSEARDTNPTLAALGNMEDQFLDTAMDIGSHLDRQTVGASWLIAGQLLTTHVQSVPPEQQAGMLGALLNVLKLAGQRLYVGERLPVEMPCPFPYASGAACKTVVKAPNRERADVLMGAHVWQQHPGETWPPKPETHEAEITVDGMVLTRALPVPDGWRGVEPTEPQPGPQYELDDEDRPRETTPDDTGRCPACGNWVALNDDDRLKLHLVNGDDSPVCEGVGQQPLSDGAQS